MIDLYTIDQQILSLIDEETGEIADYEAFEALQMERDKKLENIALWIKNLKAEEENLAVEKKAFADRQAATKSKREWLERCLATALEGKPFSTIKVKCTFKKSQAVEVTDISALPADCIRTTIEPDKTAIKQAINAGKEVAGACLVERLNLQIK